MSYLVDTNILIHGADHDSPHFAAAREFLDNCIQNNEAWFFSWVNVFEYLRLITHPGVFRHPLAPARAEENIASLLALPQVGMLTESDGYFEVYREISREAKILAGNLVHDAHIAALMKQSGVKKIYTLNRQFRIFPFLEVIDPLSK